MIKSPSVMQETQVQLLDWMIPWRSKWQPAPVFLPGKSQGQKYLVGYSPWGLKELDRTEWTTTTTRTLLLAGSPSIFSPLVLFLCVNVSLTCTDCCTPGFPALLYLLEFAQTHVHWVNNAFQPSHPLSPTSLPALNLSQHQGLFQGVSFLYQVAKILELQHQSSHWIFRVDYL